MKDHSARHQSVPSTMSTVQSKKQTTSTTPRRLVALVLLVPLAIGIPVCAAAQEEAKVFYQQREAAAPPAVKTQLESLRQLIKERNLTFDVAYTTAMDYKLEQITGLVEPENLLEKIRTQNEAAAKVTETGPISAIAGVCSDTAASFDWRQHAGATKVSDQKNCGSCWAFATLGAFEASFRLRNSLIIDASEQDLLDCNPWGYSCAGGWWAHQYLIDKGVAKEAAYPYTAVKGICKSVKRPYHAVAWGYVGNTATPSVSEIKKALCQHGPLAVAVNVTSAFASYAGKTFNACAAAWKPSKNYIVGDLVKTASLDMWQCATAGQSGTSEPAWPTTSSPPTVADGTVRWTFVGKINHGVTLIGWDDSKSAWLIKNSWGTGWGEVGGYGTERGYMWIRYECNNMGYAPSWVQAAKCQGCCDP
jgi:C1A family cysteine protease